MSSKYIKETVLSTMGTGTTLIAADQLGMDAIGIEQDAEYVRIAELRLTENIQKPVGVVRDKKVTVTEPKSGFPDEWWED